jgi:hypothetical protein
VFFWSQVVGCQLVWIKIAQCEMLKWLVRREGAGEFYPLSMGPDNFCKIDLWFCLAWCSRTPLTDAPKLRLVFFEPQQVFITARQPQQQVKRHYSIYSFRQL